MSKASTVEGVLKASLRRVRRRWAKGNWRVERPADVKNDGYGKNSYCLEGSCTGGDRIPKTPQQEAAMRVLREVVIEKTGGRHKSIPSFNDDPSTTQIDAIAVVEEALRRAKQRGV